MTKAFSDIIKTLLKGIKSDTIIEPITAAQRFSTMIESIDCEFYHVNGRGYVYHNQKKELVVIWKEDGVIFKNHQITIRTLPIIQIALSIISELDDENIFNQNKEEEESSSDTDDIWL